MAFPTKISTKTFPTKFSTEHFHKTFSTHSLSIWVLHSLLGLVVYHQQFFLLSTNSTASRLPGLNICSSVIGNNRLNWGILQWELNIFIFLNEKFIFRDSHLAKLPWKLPKQPRWDKDDSSGARTCRVLGIHSLWPWAPILMSSWPPDNHRRRRDNLDEEKLRSFPTWRHHKSNQYCEVGFPHGSERYKGRMEHQVEGFDAPG